MGITRIGFKIQLRAQRLRYGEIIVLKMRLLNETKHIICNLGFEKKKLEFTPVIPGILAINLVMPSYFEIIIICL